MVVAFRNETDSSLIISPENEALRKALQHLNHGEFIESWPLDILLVLLLCAQAVVLDAWAASKPRMFPKVRKDKLNSEETKLAY